MAGLVHIASPMKAVVDLRRAQQMLELLQSRERPKLKDLGSHLDLLEYTAEFLRARARVALAAETGKLRVDFVEIHPVTAVVRGVRAEAEPEPGNTSAMISAISRTR